MDMSKLYFGISNELDNELSELMGDTTYPEVLPPLLEGFVNDPTTIDITKYPTIAGIIANETL